MASTGTKFCELHHHVVYSGEVLVQMKRALMQAVRDRSLEVRHSATAASMDNDVFGDVIGDFAEQCPMTIAEPEEIIDGTTEERCTEHSASEVERFRNTTACAGHNDYLVELQKSWWRVSCWWRRQRRSRRR